MIEARPKVQNIDTAYVEETLSKLDLAGLYSLWHLTDLAWGAAAYSLGSLHRDDIARRDKKFASFREKIDRVNQFNGNTGKMIDADELIAHAIAVSEAPLKYFYGKDQSRDSRQIARKLHSFTSLRQLCSIVMSKICSDKTDKSIKARLFLQQVATYSEYGNYEALAYLISRNIEYDEERIDISATWQREVNRPVDMKNLGLLRVAELYNLSDIEVCCDGWFVSPNVELEYPKLSLIGIARTLFDLCRSNHMTKILHTRLVSSKEASILKLNKVFRESEDCNEGWSPIIYASAIFAIQRTEYTALAVETLENYLRTLMAWQSRDGGWPYSERSFAPLSVFSKAVAIHALAVLKPAGWESPARAASNWLKTQQSDFGLWSDPHVREFGEYQIALAVLVLDAINLAEGNYDELTFNLGSLPKRELQIPKPEVDTAKKKKSSQRGRKAKYSTADLRRAHNAFQKHLKATGEVESSYRKVAAEFDMPSWEAAKLNISRYLKKQKEKKDAADAVDDDQ